MFVVERLLELLVVPREVLLDVFRAVLAVIVLQPVLGVGWNLSKSVTSALCHNKQSSSVPIHANHWRGGIM